jgi:hypothetical protein
MRVKQEEPDKLYINFWIQESALTEWRETAPPKLMREEEERV